jgi:hypothetical protein
MLRAQFLHRKRSPRLRVKTYAPSMLNCIRFECRAKVAEAAGQGSPCTGVAARLGGPASRSRQALQVRPTSRLATLVLQEKPKDAGTTAPLPNHLPGQPETSEGGGRRRCDAISREPGARADGNSAPCVRRVVLVVFVNRHRGQGSTGLPHRTSEIWRTWTFPYGCCWRSSCRCGWARR